MSKRTRLAQQVINAVARGSPPFTAQGITWQVRILIPHADHATVKRELLRLVARGDVQQINKPRLPARYKLNRRVQ